VALDGAEPSPEVFNWGLEILKFDKNSTDL